jgi:hypothetical protein
MLYEVTTLCKKCKNEVSSIIYDGEILENCRDCGIRPFELRKIKGLIYVVHNPQQNAVKIGLTEKSIRERIKSLNSTGVAGSFIPIAVFPSDRLAADEKRVHTKLARKKISKEHFNVTPVEAVLQAYRALNKRQPIFFDPAIEENFKLRLEQARISMLLKLSGGSKK